MTTTIGVPGRPLGDRRLKSGARAASRNLELEAQRIYDQPYLVRIASAAGEGGGRSRPAEMGRATM